jgi:hypothetical protein
MKKIKFLAFAVVLAIASSCNDNDTNMENNRSNTTSTDLKAVVNNFSGNPIKATIKAIIEDENGNRLSGVTVTAGNVTATTNEKGLATLAAANVHQKFAFVKAFKTGYLDGSRTLKTVRLSNNFVTIKMYPLKDAQFIDANEGGTLTIQTPHGESTVKFAAGFIDKENNQYNGQVTVFVNYLDPLASDTRRLMPGELYAITSDNDEVALKSFGMQNIELRGEDGQELQISNPAEIRVPINPKQFDTAAQSIPMWYFNEDVGVWVEEGVGRREGNSYVAEVKHFTWWNWDVATSGFIWYTLYVIDATTGLPMPGVDVDIITPTGHGGSQTNSMGDTAGPIDPGVVCTLNLLDPVSSLSYSTSVGPYFSSTTDTIYVDFGAGTSSIFTGSYLMSGGGGFIQYSLNGGPIVVDNVNATGGITATGGLFVGAENASTNLETIILSETAMTGILPYGMTSGQMFFSSISDFGGINQSARTGAVPVITYNVINIGPVGGTIDIAFRGTYNDYAGNPYSIRGNAKVVRLF